MRVRASRFTIFFMVAAVSCYRSTHATDSHAGAEAAITARLQQWLQAYNAGDAESMIAIWDPEADESFPRGTRNYSEIVESYRQSAAERTPQRHQSVEIETVSASGDFGVTRAKWTVVESPAANNGAASERRRQSRSLEVWRRQNDGEWKIWRSLAFSLPADSGNRNPSDEIRASLEKWTRDYNAGRFDSTLFVWSPEVIGWGYGNWTRDAGVPASRPNGVRGSGGTYSLTIDEIRVMGRAALVRDRWAYQPPPSAKSSTTIRNRSFEIWELGPDGRWRITRWITQPEPK